jgi:hypothetical protein
MYMYVCMYVCAAVVTFVCMYLVCLTLFLFPNICFFPDVLYAFCMYARIYKCMYVMLVFRVCMHLCMCYTHNSVCALLFCRECMYACIYVCVMHASMYVLYTHAYMRCYFVVNVCMYASMCAHACTCVCACMYTHVNLDPHIHTCVNTHTHTHTHIHDMYNIQTCIKYAAGRFK